MKRCSIPLFALALLAGVSSSALAGNLGELLRGSGWDRMLGTWVDAETKGEKVKTTYAWRFEGTLIEATTKARGMESMMLVGRHPGTGDVYLVGADNRGGAALGKWTLDGGDAVAEIKFMAGDGTEGAVRVRHHLVDDDTLVVTIEAPEPVEVKMVRAAAPEPKP